MKNKISIIVPIFNSEKYLTRCLASLQNQTLGDYEVILINDGSIDHSACICNEFVQKDNRFRVIHKKNGGVSSARNIGLAVTQGEYVLFVDSDDYIDRHLLENLLQVGSYDLVLTGLSCMKDDTCVKTKHVEAGEWNLSYAEDRDFNIKFISHANQVCNVDYAGYYYQIDIVTGLSHKIYDYNLQNDIEYWNQLYQLLCINQANGNFPIKKYMVNKLFNYLVDNLYQISKVRNLRETFKLMSSVHPVVNWNFLKQNKEIIDCPEWMKKMLFLPSAILILLLKYYT